MGLLQYHDALPATVVWVHASLGAVLWLSLCGAGSGRASRRRRAGDGRATGAGGDLMRRAPLRLLSVVAPMLDEAEIVREFHRRVAAALEGIPFELIVVDDGSTDGTAEVLDELAAADERVRVLHLSRPFGHQMAITAGLDVARGDADGDDGRRPPGPAGGDPGAGRGWQAGGDVVVARRRERAGETRFKLTTARWFYSLMGRLAQVELEPNAGDFRLLDRQALDALLRCASAAASCAG